MLNSLVINFSVFLSLAVGAVVPFPFLLPVCSVPTVLFVLLTPWLTETPAWLSRKGDMDATQKVIKRYVESEGIFFQIVTHQSLGKVVELTTSRIVKYKRPGKKVGRELKTFSGGSLQPFTAKWLRTSEALCSQRAKKTEGSLQPNG